MRAVQCTDASVLPAVTIGAGIHIATLSEIFVGITQFRSELFLVFSFQFFSSGETCVSLKYTSEVPGKLVLF